MTTSDPQAMLDQILVADAETEWIEFKRSYAEPEKVGQYISAIANAAAYNEKETGYIVWGIDDATRAVVGTTFRPRSDKFKGQEIENWLSCNISPDVNLKIHELSRDGLAIVIFEIPSAFRYPIRFKGNAFIRVGTCKKPLSDHPERERSLWGIFSDQRFESSIAASDLTADQVLELLDFTRYFELTKQPFPVDRSGIFERLANDALILDCVGPHYEITNLGAILFAKELHQFPRLARKVIRVASYEGNSKVDPARCLDGKRGYAVGFENAIAYISSRLPHNEEIGQAMRREVRMYPDIAIRELVANALIHQDLSLSGTGPIVEIFSDRIEITSPGVPLIDTNRFIDTPSRSRNEALAFFMRRIGICEERGGGVDRVIHQVELYQLPPPSITVTADHTQVVLFAYRKLGEMDSEERVRACYQHACLRRVNHQFMTNATLRVRFGIDDKNYSIASRIISDALDAQMIKPFDPSNTSNRLARYLPYWA